MGKYLIISDCTFGTNLGSITSTSVPLTGISISNKTSIGTLAVGSKFTFITAFTPTNATNKGYSYSSSNTSVVTITAAGVMTVVGYGATTITVTSSYDSLIKDTVAVTVSQVAVTAVSITNKSTYNGTEKAVGSSFTLTSSVTPSSATNKDVTWSSSNESLATVSSAGLVTVKGEGSVTITLKSVSNSSITDSVTFTAVAASQAVAPTGIDITTVLETSYKVGDEIQLAVTITPSNATDATVSWSSSNLSVATVSTSGLVTIIGAGSVDITAKANGNTALTDKASITAVAVTVLPTGIDITTPIASSYAVGDKLQLVVSLTPSSATDKSVSWSSSDTAIATVDTAGLVTFLSVGAVSITVTSNAKPSLADSVDLTSVAAPQGAQWTAVLQPYRTDDWTNTEKVASPSTGAYINVNTAASAYTSTLVDTANNSVGTRMTRAAIAAITGKTYTDVVKYYNSGLDENGGTYYTAALANIPYLYKNTTSVGASIGYYNYGCSLGAYVGVSAVSGLPNGKYKAKFFVHTNNSDHAAVWGANSISINGAAVSLKFKNATTVATSVDFCEEVTFNITNGIMYIETTCTTAQRSSYNIMALEYWGAGTW